MSQFFSGLSFSSHVLSVHRVSRKKNGFFWYRCVIILLFRVNSIIKMTIYILTNSLFNQAWNYNGVHIWCHYWMNIPHIIRDIENNIKNFTHLLFNRILLKICDQIYHTAFKFDHHDHNDHLTIPTIFLYSQIKYRF